MDAEDLTLSQLVELVEKGRTKELEELMLKHRSKWNLLMEESRKLSKRIELRNIVLRGIDLSGLDLSGADIEDSDLSDSDLSDSNLDNTVIRNVAFYNSNLSNTSMRSSRISQADFTSAKLYNADIEDSLFTGSVRLFGTYLKEQEHYDTSPEITKDGFQQMEMYEHMDDEDDTHYHYH